MHVTASTPAALRTLEYLQGKQLLPVQTCGCSTSVRNGRCAVARLSCVLQVTVRKGDSIGVFLKAVREQLAPQFRELRAVSVDNMMYIKVGGRAQQQQWASAVATLMCGSSYGSSWLQRLSDFGCRLLVARQWSPVIYTGLASSNKRRVLRLNSSEEAAGARSCQCSC